MPVTQEFLLSLSAFWLFVLVAWKAVEWLSGERPGEKK